MSEKTTKDQPDEALHAVIYTDGGCKPSRGIGGWGIHGYFYHNTPPKQGSGCKQGFPSPYGYVDNADIPKVTVVKYVDGWGSLIPESTNNEAELMAALNALQVAAHNDVVSLHLKLDSQYVKDGFDSWAQNWEANGWVKRDGGPIANAPLWKKILEAERVLLGKGVNITTEWVKGHSGILGNTLADLLASRGVVVGRKGMSQELIRYTEAKGYWSQKPEINRMLSQNNWYFNTHVGGTPKTPDGRTIYHLGNHGKEDDFVGKPISDACFSVVFVKKADPVLEEIRAYQDTVSSDTFNSVIIGRLDNLFKAEVYSEIQEFKSLFIQRIMNHKLDLFDVQELPLTKELRPPRLAFRVVAALEVMESILGQYVANPEEGGFVVTDLTDVIYEVDTSKKKPVGKLHSSITPATKSFKVKAGYDTGAKKGEVELALTVGLDIASRNTLSALASFCPKVKLITWRESDKAIRYATIIETDDDIGIWAGIYSNLHLLTS